MPMYFLIAGCALRRYYLKYPTIFEKLFKNWLERFWMGIGYNKLNPNHYSSLWNSTDFENKIWAKKIKVWEYKAPVPT